MVLVVLLLSLAAYGIYDWTRPCTGGPVTQFVKSVAAGGSFTVRCAG